MLVVPINMDEDKFWANVSKTDECWEWTGYRDPKNYGRVMVKTERGWRPMLAHRASWWLANGDLPTELDHLCRNPPCVRTDHLESVSHLVNMQRTSRDTCKRGHQEWYIQPDGGRRCRACIREYDRVHVPPSRADDEHRKMMARGRSKRFYQRKKQRHDAGETEY